MKFVSYSILLLLPVAISFQSCKQELISSPEQYSKIYMPQAVDSPAVRNLIMTDTLQSIVFGAEFGGIENSPADIAVRFQDNLSLVSAYNTKSGTAYLPMPSSAYTLTGTEATIKAGGLTTGALRIKVKTVGGIEPLKEYLLPVSISEVNSSVPVNEKLRTTYFLIKGTYEDFIRSGWTIYQFSSEDNVQTSPLVLDGDVTTMWHTAWRNGTVNPPHFIAIDMKETKGMHGVYMWPDNRTTGAPRDIRIDVSTDGQNWSSAGDYTLPNTNERHTIYFSTLMQARYFKVTVKNTQGNLAVTRLTEIGAF